MPQLRRPLLLSIPLLTGVALGLGCGNADAVSEAPPPPVRVTEVVIESRSPVVRVLAVVRAERRATLRAEAAGRVIEAPHRRGESVSEGDLLVRVSGPRTANAVSEAQAQVEQLRAALRQATRQREHAESLAAQNANTASTVDSARDRETEAQARLDAATARARSARAGVNETVLRAPFGGVLASFGINIGEYLRPGAEVAVLVDRTQLEAELLLDPSEANQAAVGDRVTMETPTLEGRVFEGHVTSVGEVLDPRTRRLPVRVAIDDAEGAVRPGGVAEFAVAIGEPRPVSLLPADAVSRRMGQTQVFVVVDGAAVARTVVLGGQQETVVEVLSGLDVGERAIVSGIERVVAGEPVRVVDEPPEDSES